MSDVTKIRLIVFINLSLAFSLSLSPALTSPTEYQRNHVGASDRPCLPSGGAPSVGSVIPSLAPVGALQGVHLSGPLGGSGPLAVGSPLVGGGPQGGAGSSRRPSRIPQPSRLPQPLRHPHNPGATDPDGPNKMSGRLRLSQYYRGSVCLCVCVLKFLG